MKTSDTGIFLKLLLSFIKMIHHSSANRLSADRSVILHYFPDRLILTSDFYRRLSDVLEFRQDPIVVSDVRIRNINFCEKSLKMGVDYRKSSDFLGFSRILWVCNDLSGITIVAMLPKLFV